MFKLTQDRLDEIVKKDVHDALKQEYESLSAWPATRRYSHEEWTLFLDAFRRGVFEQKQSSKSDIIFLAYPAREELGFKLAREFFEKKFKSEYNYHVIWTPLKLKDHENDNAAAKFDPEKLKSIFEQARKGEIHFMLLISIKENEMEEVRDFKLEATINLFRKIVLAIDLKQKSKQASQNIAQTIQFNLRILVADLLQAYNQVSQEVQPDMFFSEIHEKSLENVQGKSLAEYWKNNGKQWIKHAEPKFALLNNQFKNSNICLNLNIVTWSDILQEARANDYGFDDNIVALEAFSLSSSEESSAFSRAVNFKAHYHRLLFTAESKEKYLQLVEEKKQVYKNSHDAGNPQVVEQVRRKEQSTKNKKNEEENASQNIIGYSKERSEENRQLLNIVNRLLGEKSEKKAFSLSRTTNLVPSKQEYWAQREVWLKKINEQFTLTAEDPALHKLVCLHGVGGAGKTTLAILYQYWKKRRAYAGTLWIEGRFGNSHKEDPVKKYIKQFALQLGLKEDFFKKNEKPHKEIRTKIEAFLREKKNPLLIMMDDISFETSKEEREFNQFILDILPRPKIYIRFISNLTYAPLDEEENKHRSDNRLYRCVKYPEKWRIYYLSEEKWQEESENPDLVALLRGKTVDSAHENVFKIKYYLAKHLKSSVPSCNILLTSRSKLNFSRSHGFLNMITTEVTGMDKDEARDFLKKNKALSQKTLDAAQKIAKKFGFLPLMLRLIKDNIAMIDETNVSKFLSINNSLEGYTFHSREPGDHINTRSCYIYRNEQELQGYALLVIHESRENCEKWPLLQKVLSKEPVKKQQKLLASIERFIGCNELDDNLTRYISRLALKKVALASILWRFITNIEIRIEKERFDHVGFDEIKTKPKQFIQDILYLSSLFSTNSIRLSVLKEWFEGYYEEKKDSYKLNQYSNASTIFDLIKDQLIKKAIFSYNDKNNTVSVHMVIQEILQRKSEEENPEDFDNIIYSFVTYFIQSIEIFDDCEQIFSIVKHVKSKVVAEKILYFLDDKINNPPLAWSRFGDMSAVNSMLTYSGNCESDAGFSSMQLDVNMKIYHKNKNLVVAFSGLKNIIQNLHEENIEKAIAQLILLYNKKYSRVLSAEEAAKNINQRFKYASFSEELEKSIKSDINIESFIVSAVKAEQTHLALLLSRFHPDVHYRCPDGKELVAFIVMKASSVELTQQVLKYTSFNETTKKNCLRISNKDLQASSSKAGYLYYKTLLEIKAHENTSEFYHNYACYCAATRHNGKADFYFKHSIRMKVCASSFVVYACFLLLTESSDYKKIEDLLFKSRSLLHDIDVDFQTVPQLLDPVLAHELSYVKCFKISPWLLSTWRLICFYQQQNNTFLALIALDELKKYADIHVDKTLAKVLLAYAALSLNQYNLLISTFTSIRDPSELLCNRIPLSANVSYHLAKKYRLSAQYTKALPYLKKAALQGHIYAMVRYAICCVDEQASLSLEENQEKLIFWSRKIWDQLEELHIRALENDAEAQYALSICYQDGLGVAIDYKKAFYYAMRASAQGHIFAINLLAYYFHNGYYVDKSEEKAIYYYQLSAMQGHADAHRNLFFVFKEKNTEISLDWLKRSAKAGHPKSSYDLAEHLLKTHSTITPEIFFLYLQAAEHDHGLAQLRVAECYEQGVMVDKNREIAGIFYKKAEINISKSECVYKVKGEDKGRNAWYYVLVNTRSIYTFLKELNSEIISLEDHGKVLYSAYGDEPPQKVTDDLKKEYKTDAELTRIDFAPYISAAQQFAFFKNSKQIYRHYEPEMYLINHRHDNPRLQNLYDQRFGLAIIPRP